MFILEKKNTQLNVLKLKESLELINHGYDHLKVQLVDYEKAKSYGFKLLYREIFQEIKCCFQDLTDMANHCLKAYGKKTDSSLDSSQEIEIFVLPDKAKTGKIWFIKRNNFFI